VPVSQSKKGLEENSTQTIKTRHNFLIRNIKYVSENYGLSVWWFNNKVDGPVVLGQLNYFGFVRLDQASNKIPSAFHTKISEVKQ
jgi:hypothetical protein